MTQLNRFGLGLMLFGLLMGVTPQVRPRPPEDVEKSVLITFVFELGGWALFVWGKQ